MSKISEKDKCFSLIFFLKTTTAKSVDSDHTAPAGAVRSGSTLFAPMFLRDWGMKFLNIYCLPYLQPSSILV